MICVSCKENKHEFCPGFTWCNCQHNVELGQASRDAQALLILAQANAEKVNACSQKEIHSKMGSCKECPYGQKV